MNIGASRASAKVVGPRNVLRFCVHGRWEVPARRFGLHKWVLGFLLVLASVGRAASQPSIQPSTGGQGTGRELLADCQRYFVFLGRTGAGKADTFAEDPFGMGYCAGLLRGVATSVEAFHPRIECRLDAYSSHHVVRAVVRFLELNSDVLDEPDSELVLRALQEEGMCAIVRP